MGRNYRIVPKGAYNGCEPITAWMVQVREPRFFLDKWRDVKGFELKSKAIELYEILSGESYYG